MLDILDWKNLKLTAIDPSATWNIFPPDDNIKSSIPQHELDELLLTHFLLVTQADKNGTYELIAGHDIYQQINKRDTPVSISCKVIGSQNHPKDILEAIYYVERLCIERSPIVKANFFRLVLDQLDDRESCVDFIGKLTGKGINNHIFDEVIAPLRLDQETIIRLHSGSISPQLTPTLLKMNEQQRHLFIELIDKLGLGGSKQKRLLELCTDIAGREEVTMSDILGEEAIQSILHHKEMNIPQKVNQLLEALHQRCFPRSSEAYKVFTTRRSALQLPSNVTLTPSQSFERDQVTLTVVLPSLEETEKLWSQIGKYFRKK